MRGPRITINTAVLATAIRINGLLERNIGRIVPIDDGACSFSTHDGFKRWERFIHIPPSVIDDLRACGFEAAFRIRSRSTARLQLVAVNSRHGPSILDGHPVWK